MADIFDLGVDFGLSYFKSKTEKEKVTRKEYNRNPIDFYTQSLQESTGIGVLGDPVKKEEKEESININVIGKPEEGSSENPNALDMNQMLSESSFVSKAISSELKNTPTDIMNWGTLAPNKTYGKALASVGYKDRSPSFNIFDTDMYFATAPRSGKDVKEGIKGAFSWESLAKKGLGYLGIDPLVSGVAGAFITGRAVPNALGKDSYRPDHAFLGGVFDVVNSIQFADVAINSAAINAYTGSGMSNQFSPTTGYDHVAGRATGFNAEVGGHLVTKRAGSTSYTGGFQSHETNKAVEALTKGYLPSTYNNKNETGERGVTSIDSRGGMYSERGTYHYVGGIAATGSMQAARDLAIARGITTQEAIDGLNKVRSQYDIFGRVKDKTKTPKTLTQIFAEKANKKFKDSSYSYTTRDTKRDPSLVGRMKDTFTKTSPVVEKYLNNRFEISRQEKNIADAEAISKATYDDMVAKQNLAGKYQRDDGGNRDDGSQSVSDQAATADQQGGIFSAKGGFVSKGNFATGGKAEPAGFIEGPPEQFNDQTTIADDIPLTVKDGTFVLNAPAVENEGSSSVQKMLVEGYQKAMTRDVGNGHSIQTGKIPNRGELDIQISRGEVVVPPHVARAIGYDKLEKINNRGKREVERRQQKAGDQEKVQAGQGFAAGGGEQFGTKVTPVTDSRFSSGWEAVKNKFKGKDNADRANKSRDKIAEVLKTFAPQEIMAFIAMSEASVLGDRGAEGTLHSLMNRVGSNVDDFKPLQDVYSAAVKRFPGQGKNKVFQFNGIEITDFRRYLGEMQDSKSYTSKQFKKYVQLADEVMTGQREDFTKGSTFFWNPKSNKSKSNFFAKGLASGRLVPTVTIKGPKGMEHQHLKIVEDDVYERSQFPEDNYIDPKFAQKVGTDTKDSMFAQKFNPKIDVIDPMFGQKNTTKKVEEDRSGSFLSNFIASQFQDNY